MSQWEYEAGRKICLENMAKGDFSNGWNRPLSPAEEEVLEHFRKSAIHRCKHCGQCTVEQGWLIEKNLGGKPLWLTCNWSFGWTEDSAKSIRFSRREDAEQIATMFENDDISITEHEWS